MLPLNCVTITLTEEQKILLTLRQEELLGKLPRYAGMRDELMRYSLEGFIAYIAELDLYDSGKGIFTDKDTGTARIEGYYEGYMNGSTWENIETTLTWIAQSGGHVVAYLEGDDGGRWRWQTRTDTFALETTRYADVVEEEAQAVATLRQQFEDDPSLWSTVPPAIAETLQRLW